MRYLPRVLPISVLSPHFDAGVYAWATYPCGPPVRSDVKNNVRRIAYGRSIRLSDVEAPYNLTTELKEED
jgi:hypothetical protein